MNPLVIVLFLGVVVFFQEFSGTRNVEVVEALDQTLESNQLDSSNSANLFSCRYSDEGVPYRNLALETSTERTSQQSDNDVLEPAEAGVRELSEDEDVLSEPIGANTDIETEDFEE